MRSRGRWLDIPAEYSVDQLPRALAYFKKNPLGPETFRGRLWRASARMGRSGGCRACNAERSHATSP